MTRRTLIANKLAKYFKDQDIDFVKELPMEVYSGLENTPYKGQMLKRLYGSWSRTMLIVQTQIDKIYGEQQERILAPEAPPLITNDPFAAFAHLKGNNV